MLLIPQLLLHSGLISKKSFFLVKDIVTESTPTMWLWSEILAIGKPFSGSLSFPHNNYFSKNLQICFFKKRTSIFSIDWVPQFWLKRRSSLLCFFYLNYSHPPPPPRSSMKILNMEYDPNQTKSTSQHIDVFGTYTNWPLVHVRQRGHQSFTHSLLLNANLAASI
jgi:hypothetical protein